MSQGSGNHLPDLPDLGAKGDGQVNFPSLLAHGQVENSEPKQFS